MGFSISFLPANIYLNLSSYSCLIYHIHCSSSTHDDGEVPLTWLLSVCMFERSSELLNDNCECSSSSVYVHIKYSFYIFNIQIESYKASVKNMGSEESLSNRKRVQSESTSHFTVTERRGPTAVPAATLQVAH